MKRQIQSLTYHKYHKTTQYTKLTKKKKKNQLQPILDIDPQEWTQAQVIKWLQLTHDGDLADLIEPFKA